jgi:two-component system, NarL family, response regulator NreC
MSISILLVDDHAIFRQALQLLLENQPDLCVAAQAADGMEAISLAEQKRPDVMVLDLSMPGLDGMEVIKIIKQRLPKCHIIVLSMHGEKEYVLRAMQYGASGYILKESSGANLVQGVRAVMAGEKYLCPRLAELAVKVFLSQSLPPETDHSSLTRREREVLLLSVDGLNTAEIARRLSISPRTVETHRANFMRKLGLHTQVELVKYAQQMKFMPD